MRAQAPMPNTAIFLCGLSKAQRSSYGAGRQFHLHGAEVNVRLELDDIRRQLVEAEPPLLTDLVEIAAYVFAADCSVRRGGPALKGMGERWKRRFHLVVAVRAPGLWTQPQILHALSGALEFLSGDAWTFEFVENASPTDLSAYLNYSNADPATPSDSAVVLFSGGLDSFAGAVQELNSGDRHVILVSRRLGGMTDRRQRELAEELKARYPRRVTHVPVRAGLTEETKAAEYTQRTRSFLLSALAILTAAIERSNRICFYENGIMSINLPISTQVIGSRASRSTHPRSLMLLRNLTTALGYGNIDVTNPFIWKTKAEVVRELLERPEANATRRSLSCSRTQEMTIAKPHCGACAQCLQRRMATIGIDPEYDPADAYAIDFLTGSRNDGVESTMAFDMVHSALDFVRLSDVGFVAKFATELGWIATSFPERAQADVIRLVLALCRRHGHGVREIFVRATAEQATGLVDRSLSQNCLLRLFHDAASSMESAQGPIAAEGQSERNEVLTKDWARVPEIVIAVDEGKKWILIEGIAPITGSTLFRLVQLLADRYLRDQAALRAAENYQLISTQELAKHLTLALGQTPGRQINRVRRHFSQGLAQLYNDRVDNDAVIENVHGKGYRLNPRTVRVVAAQELGQV